MAVDQEVGPQLAGPHGGGAESNTGANPLTDSSVAGWSKRPGLRVTKANAREVRRRKLIPMGATLLQAAGGLHTRDGCPRAKHTTTRFQVR